MDSKTLRNRMKRNPFFIVGATACVFLLICVFIVPIFLQFDPIQNDLSSKLTPPQGFSEGLGGHILGTDQMGRDILTRLLIGGRYSLGVAFVVATLQILLGTTLGVLAGYFGGVVDMVIMRFCEVMLAIPNLILAIAVMSIVGGSIGNLVFVLFITGWIRNCKITRNEVRVMKSQEFTHAALALGASNRRVMVREILPNVTTQIIIQASQRVGLTILIEASLSFLGLGIMPPIPSWGNMISVGRGYMTNAPWMVFAPGIALMITCLAFNFLGDGLRDILDPKRTV